MVNINYFLTKSNKLFCFKVLAEKEESSSSTITTTTDNLTTDAATVSRIFL